MQQYIKNLLPRLRQLTQTLEHAENFVDKPWVHIHQDKGRLLYIFKRDYGLLLSINGKVTSGTWEYIQPANSLLISYSGEQYLLNHAFVSNGIMVLRLDGTENFWVMINEQVIPDLDVEKYLGNFVQKSTSNPGDKYLLDVEIETNKGIVHVKARQGILTRGLDVLNWQSFPDGVYLMTNDTQYKALEIEKGKISRIVHKGEDGEVILLVVGAVIFLLILLFFGLRQ